MDDLEAVLRKRLDNAGYPDAKISRSGGAENEDG